MAVERADLAAFHRIVPGAGVKPDGAGPETVSPGGKVFTGTAAEPGDPVETSVTLPLGGTVSIIEKLLVQPDPPGYQLFGQQVNISAPASTAQFPLIIMF